MFSRLLALSLLLLGLSTFAGCGGGVTEEGRQPPPDTVDDETIPQNPPDGGMVP